MATISGTNIVVSINGTTIGHSLALVLDLGQDLPDASSRNSLGWKEHIHGVRNASLSIGGLTDYSDSMNFNQLASFIISRESISFRFTSSGAVFYGEASVEDIEELATFEEVVSYNLDLKVNNIVISSDYDSLLLQTGDYLLLQTGFKLLLQ